MNIDISIEMPVKGDKSAFSAKYSLEFDKNSKNENSTLMVVRVSERILKVFRFFGSLYWAM
jgi:hypothetical protein